MAARKSRKTKPQPAAVTPKDTLLPLRRATLAAWLFYIALMGLLWGQIVSGTLHFRPIPLLILLAGVLISTFAALGFSFRPFLSGTRQAVVSGWILLALFPVLLLVTPCVYARQRQMERQFVKSPAMHLARAIGASLMEADIALRYPHRLETPRLVMFYNGLSNPKQEAEAMERHVAKLETLLGRRLRSKIHWVRGSALGQSGLSFFGIALGSGRDHNAPDGDLTLDRHELAHAVLTQQEPWNASPPAFLIEGWAELQGLGSRKVQRRGWQMHAANETKPFATLLQPAWYHKHDGPAYTQGGAFVDFLLRHYRVEKFLSLYNTTSQRTFRADFRSIYGDDITQLEERFWQELSRLGRKSP